MEWRTVSANPAYEVSDQGQVRKTSSGCMMAQRPNDKGYAKVEIWGGGKRKNHSVARLVCEAWHGPPPFPKAQAAHLDGNKLNNVPSNLAWTTNKENAQHRILHGTQPRGMGNPRAKISEQEVAEILALPNERGVQAAIARRLGIGQTQVSRIRHGRQWVHLSAATSPPQKEESNG